MAQSVDDRYFLVIDGTEGCGTYHPDKGFGMLDIVLLANNTFEFGKGPKIVPVADCHFIVDTTLTNGAWFDPSTYTFAFNSENSKRWHLETWAIKPLALAA